ncbi:hypothetical protein WMF37_40205 [Sorangium sp. So ce291]|uniref:hypothetical protein n=1 Tax=Sorangium sp. So ce291 TaxID=3133294 RepID=UPI003F642D41
MSSYWRARSPMVRRTRQPARSPLRTSKAWAPSPARAQWWSVSGPQRCAGGSSNAVLPWTAKVQVQPSVAAAVCGPVRSIAMLPSWGS